MAMAGCLLVRDTKVGIFGEMGNDGIWIKKAGLMKLGCRKRVLDKKTR
jgi:hypothetical protein